MLSRSLICDWFAANTHTKKLDHFIGVQPLTSFIFSLLCYASFLAQMIKAPIYLSDLPNRTNDSPMFDSSNFFNKFALNLFTFVS